MGYSVELTESVISESVAANKPQRFKPVPVGKQNFTVYDAEVKEFGPNAKNPGEPYYSISLRIDGGDYDGRKINRVMVPFRTNWAPSTDPKKLEKNPNGFPTIFVPFFQALGFDPKKGKFNVPEPSEIMGKPLSASVTIEPDEYAFKRAQDDGELGEDETQKDFVSNGVRNFAPPFERDDAASKEDSFDLK